MEKKKAEGYDRLRKAVLDLVTEEGQVRVDDRSITWLVEMCSHSVEVLLEDMVQIIAEIDKDPKK